MSTDIETARKLFSKDLIDAAIRIGMIAVLVILCFRIFAPFAGMMMGALILAVAFYPLHQSISKRMGDKDGRAATLIVVVGILIIGGPMIMLGASFADNIFSGYASLESASLTIPAPPDFVAGWPLIGGRLHGAWAAAANNLPAFLVQYQEQLKGLAGWVLSTAAGTAGTLLLFLATLAVSGIMMAYGKSGTQAIHRILSKVAGPAKGPKMQVLSTATVRSVATGVIGVAFIQALLLGAGFMFAGIPAAGVFAVLILIAGIMQIPAALFSLPAIAFVWMSGDASTAMNVVLSVYLLVASLADNVLKPMLLGRGVDAPMPVILIGALGGMIVSGFMGLFIGAVLLAVGYQIFMEWVDDVEPSSDTAAIQSGAGGQPLAGSE